MKQPMRPLAKKLYLLAGSCVLSLFLLEVASRFIRDPRKEPVVPTAVGRFDKDLGWALQPGACAVSDRTGRRIEYKINSKGLRDNETPYKKPEGVYRIVLLGCSRTFGFGNPIEEHFSTLLENYFDHVEVINMGVSGYGIDQYYLSLEKEGFKYEPDLVIAYVSHYGGFRHMKSKSSGRAKPYFEEEDGQLVLKNCPLSPPDWMPDKVGVPTEIHQWLRRHSCAYELLRDALFALISPAAPAANISTYDDLSEESTSEEFLQANRLALLIAGAMNDACHKQHADFLLVTGVPALHESATAMKIPSLDVSAAQSNDRLALPDGLQHLNYAGNGVIAWEIARALDERQLVSLKRRDHKKP